VANKPLGKKAGNKSRGEGFAVPELISFGVLTLLGKHVRQFKSGVVLRFPGKKGVKVSLRVDDAEVAAMLVERAQKAGLDGRLFPHVSAASLRAHLRAIGFGEFRMSDFRILVAMRIARAEMKQIPVPKTEQEYKTAINQVSQAVAEKLDITADLAVKSYIDPKVFWKWTKKWTSEDHWTTGRDGEPELICQAPRFTRKEYGEMRAESVLRREAREKAYDAEEVEQLRRHRMHPGPRDRQYRQ
jgi:DNA topoisomerase IB